MSISEKALTQSWAPFKPTCMPHSQKLSRIPCETIESDRLALVARTRTLRPRVRRVLISGRRPTILILLTVLPGSATVGA